MKTLSKKSQFAVLRAMIKNYSRTISKRRAARLCWSAFAGSPEIFTEEKVRAAIAEMVKAAGDWESAFNALRSLPCYLPSELEKLRSWVRSKKGNAL